MGRDREKTIDRDETVHIKRDRTERVDNNETISIVNNRKVTVGGNEKVSIAKNLTHSVGQTEIKSVGMMRFQAVGLNETLTVGGMQQSLVGLSRIQKVGGKDSLKVGKTLSIEAGETIELVCGDSKLVLTPSAIHLDTPDIHLLGGKSVNIDGPVININVSMASAARPEGPDEPEEASLQAVEALSAVSTGAVSDSLQPSSSDVSGVDYAIGGAELVVKGAWNGLVEVTAGLGGLGTALLTLDSAAGAGVVEGIRENMVGILPLSVRRP